MKLLFDENLSPRLSDLLRTEFPGSSHVRDVGLLGADDVPCGPMRTATTRDRLEGQ